MSASSSGTSDLDLQKVVEDLFLVLSPKEKEVIIKRFALDNKSRLTLESIGKKFGVTRERIRQIEKIALTKLRRTADNTKLKLVTDLAQQILNKNGGLLTEEALVEQILSTIKSSNEVDGNIVRLALIIHPDINQVKKADSIFPYFYAKTVAVEDVNTVNKKTIQLLDKKGDTMSEGKLLSDLALVFSAEDMQYSPEFILSSIKTDRRMKKIESLWGLMSWRHVNPKSIRDKAYIVLKRAQKPLHFDDLAKRIKEAKFDKKSVTTQAVHNELIRYDQFVLVGRGLYGLKEWGYKEGTVSDIIEDLLKKKSPLTKQEITTGVLKQRHVKKGTISLNLQKNTHFVRVGRALYAFDASKK